MLCGPWRSGDPWGVCRDPLCPLGQQGPESVPASHHLPGLPDTLVTLPFPPLPAQQFCWLSLPPKCPSSLLDHT